MTETGEGEAGNNAPPPSRVASLIDYFEPKLERLGEASSRWLNVPAPSGKPLLSSPSGKEGAPECMEEKAASRLAEQLESLRGVENIAEGAGGRTDPYRSVI